MEKAAKCPLCKELHGKCVVEETVVDGLPFKSYICFKCGMTTNSYFSLDSEKLEQMVENNTQLMNDLRIIDVERGLVWFPSVINMGEKGIIYPDGLEHDWYWHYAEVVAVPEEERDQYDGHDKRLSIDNPQRFGQFEFEEACKAMGVLVEDA